MDSDLAKALFPFLGGLLTLVGGAFVFINGRLQEAKTPSARRQVVTITLQVLSVVFNFSALAVGIFLKFGFVMLAMFCVGFAFQVAIFLRNAGSITRLEVVIFTLMCCTFTLAFGGIVIVDLLERIIDVIRDLTQIARHIVDQSGKP